MLDPGNVSVGPYGYNLTYPLWITSVSLLLESLLESSFSERRAVRLSWGNLRLGEFKS